MTIIKYKINCISIILILTCTEKIIKLFKTENINVREFRFELEIPGDLFYKNTFLRSLVINVIYKKLNLVKCNNL